MKKKLLGLVLMAGLAAIPASARAADNDTGADMHKLDARLDSAANTLDQIEGVKLKAVPDWIASKAKCVAVVPGLVKGAFIVGAEYGQGVVSCRTARGWSGPVFIRMAGGSWGFQIGGSGTDLVLVAMNQQGMQDLLQTRFKIGGTAAVAAGPIGREAQAATNLSLHAELLTYSRSHGLFAGVDLSGVTVSDNTEDTVALYGGKYANFQQILDGHVPPPHNQAATHFRHVLNQYFGQAKAQMDHHEESSNEHCTCEHWSGCGFANRSRTVAFCDQPSRASSRPRRSSACSSSVIPSVTFLIAFVPYRIVDDLSCRDCRAKVETIRLRHTGGATSLMRQASQAHRVHCVRGLRGIRLQAGMGSARETRARYASQARFTATWNPSSAGILSHLQKIQTETSGIALDFYPCRAEPVLRFSSRGCDDRVRKGTAGHIGCPIRPSGEQE